MSGQSKNSTARLVAFGYLVGARTGTCEGCQRWPKAVKYVELHWKQRRDQWTTVMLLCGVCTALCVTVLEDGADPVALFGTRYPFVT